MTISPSSEPVGDEEEELEPILEALREWQDNQSNLVPQVGGTNEVRYYTHDSMGSGELITDASGNATKRQLFDAWGQMLTRGTNPVDLQTFNQSGAAAMVDVGFTGHPGVESAGLVDMQGRLYDPIVGRFLSADPLVQNPAWAQSFNRYTYVLNNPLKYIDPTGFQAESKADGGSSDGGTASESGGISEDGGSSLFTIDPEVIAADPFRAGAAVADEVGKIRADIAALDPESDADMIAVLRELEAGYMGLAVMIKDQQMRGSLNIGPRIVSENSTQITNLALRSASFGAAVGLFGAVEVVVGALVGEAVDTGLDYAGVSHPLARIGAHLLTGGLVGASKRIASRVVQRAKQLAQTLRRGCFVAGTMVATADGPVPIEQIQVGTRVLTVSSTISDEVEKEESPGNWWRIDLDDRDDVRISLLRPGKWISRHGLAAGAAKNLYINLPELDTDGQFLVREIRRAPISNGPGRLVTASFERWNNDLYELSFLEHGRPLRGTGAHPLYSLDRGDWVRVRDLQVGERLQTAENALTIASLEKVRGVHRVYNLEVKGEHEYLVGEAAVRAHNSSALNCGLTHGQLPSVPASGWGERLARSIPKPSWPGIISRKIHAHHIFKKGDPDFPKLREIVFARFGMDIAFDNRALVWAYNGAGNTPAASAAVREGLGLLRNGGSKSDFLGLMKRLGSEAAARRP